MQGTQEGTQKILHRLGAKSHINPIFDILNANRLSNISLDISFESLYSLISITISYLFPVTGKQQLLKLFSFS